MQKPILYNIYGFGNVGKTTYIQKIINLIDPRFVKYDFNHIDADTKVCVIYQIEEFEKIENNIVDGELRIRPRYTSNEIYINIPIIFMESNTRIDRNNVVNILVENTPL